MREANTSFTTSFLRKEAAEAVMKLKERWRSMTIKEERGDEEKMSQNSKLSEG
ncbi:MAG: hypothetical protein ACLRTA_00395 [Clostridia bacterium]